MENSVDLDLQKPADLDLHCFPKKRIHPSVFVCVDALCHSQQILVMLVHFLS